MNSSKSFELYHLMNFSGITRRLVQQYLIKDPQLTLLRTSSPKDLQQILNVKPQYVYSLLNYLNNEKFRKASYENYIKYKPFTIFDSLYPNELRQIPDPPLIMYWKGNLNLLQTAKLSVIGTRTPSQYATRKLNTLLKPIIKENITIVSGLAYGIDAMSHKMALDNNGLTIAILGFGFNHIYPKENIALLHEIMNKGLVLSEYPPDTRPKRWHFPERNRIISGLSPAILIIEASERSGTMITADQALEQGREVLAVPDSIFLEQAKGCLKLIRDGATPVTNSDEIMSLLNHHYLYKSV